MLSLLFTPTRPRPSTPPRPLATIDRTGFQKIVLPRDGASLVVFGASWHRPTMAHLGRIADRRGVAALFVDVDRSPELARRYGVTAITSFLLFHRGQEAARRLGELNEHRLEDWLAGAIA